MNERASFLCDTAGNTVTVYIRGEIDHHTAVLVRNGIDAILFEKRPSKLILDLSAVGFMDSSGLGLIMGRLSVMTSLGGEMIVHNPSRETESILTLAGMERLITIEYTDGQARDIPMGREPHSKTSPIPTKSQRKGQTRRTKTASRRVKTPTTSA